MSKIKSLITPALQAELKPVEPPRGFMAALDKLAAPFSQPHASSDPVVRMRSKFSENAEIAVQALRSGVEKSKWFRKLPDGKLVVSFRNANSVLTLNGTKHFQVADVESAAKLLEAAKAAASAGELDEVLKATRRTPPTRVKKESGTAA